MPAFEQQWECLLRAANSGDETAYRRFLEQLSPAIRAIARRGFSAGNSADVEDVVQETLLAIHLKRHTWIDGEPLLPWVRAIARNKIIDVFRKKGRRVYVPIDDVLDVLPAEPGSREQEQDLRDAERFLVKLRGRQRDVVTAISFEGASIAEVARRLEISEGAVRVALHRGLQALAAAYREATS